MAFDMKGNNHRNYVRSLQKKGRIRKERRIQELIEGASLTAQEKAIRREAQIEEMELRLGIDGRKKSDMKEPSGAIGPNSSNAWSRYEYLKR